MHARVVHPKLNSLFGLIHTMPSFIRAGFTGLQWLAALVLLTLGWNLKNPLLLPYRHFETAVLLVFILLFIAAVVRWKRGRDRIPMLSVLIMTAILGVVGEFTFRYQKRAVLETDMPAASRLGQYFVVGYDSRDQSALRILAGRGLIGGIFITRRNAAGRTADDLRQEISELQALRQSAGLPSLIVATDQEGGVVSRLSPPLSNLPPLAALVAESRNGEEMEARAEAYGKQQGRELAALGVTVNFSPVVDLKTGHADQLLDFHSQIAQRAISADPVVTARTALAYSRGLEAHGVRPTLKHFPGLGRVKEDTHHFSAALDTPIAELDSHDWVPFKQVAKASNALLMLGHVSLSGMDRENPVSFSRPVVQNIIRGDWKYEGVLITDDLTMGAAYRHGLCNATVKAINAGVDLLLVSYDYEQYYKALYCAARAYGKGQLDLTMLERSRGRIAGLVGPAAIRSAEH